MRCGRTRPAAAPRRRHRSRCRRAAGAVRAARDRLAARPAPRAARASPPREDRASPLRSSASSLRRLEAERAEIHAELRRGRPPPAPAAPGPSPPARRACCPPARRPASAPRSRWPSSITGTVAEPELPRRHHPAVPGDDAVRAVDQHRVGEAELPDRARDQRHLRLAVRPRVAGVGDQLIEPGDSRSRGPVLPPASAPPAALLPSLDPQPPGSQIAGTKGARCGYYSISDKPL